MAIRLLTSLVEPIFDTCFAGTIRPTLYCPPLERSLSQWRATVEMI